MSWKLLIIEAVGAPGKGNLILTGQPGHVIKESAQVALSLVRTRAKGLGTPEDFYEKLDPREPCHRSPLPATVPELDECVHDPTPTHRPHH